MTKGLISFFSTLQYSIISLLQGQDFQELLQPLNNLFIGYNSALLWFFRWQGTGSVQFGCKSFGIGCNRLVDGFGNGFKHAVEYPLVERIKTIPVQNSKQPFGQKSREHLKFHLTVCLGRYLKFKQGLTGCFHLSHQQQPLRRIHL